MVQSFGTVFLIFTVLALEVRESWGADSVAESPRFGLNLDPRVSIVDTAPVDYVIWLTQFYTIEDLFNLPLVAEDSDPDNDGGLNRFEYRANLDPTDAGDRIRISFDGSSEGSVTFSPLKAGVNFRIELSNDLEDWQVLAPDLYEKFGDDVKIDLGELPDRAFYRVELLEPDPSN